MAKEVTGAQAHPIEQPERKMHVDVGPFRAELSKLDENDQICVYAPHNEGRATFAFYYFGEEHDGNAIAWFKQSVDLQTVELVVPSKLFATDMALLSDPRFVECLLFAHAMMEEFDKTMQGV